MFKEIGRLRFRFSPSVAFRLARFWLDQKVSVSSYHQVRTLLIKHSTNTRLQVWSAIVCRPSLNGVLTSARCTGLGFAFDASTPMGTSANLSLAILTPAHSGFCQWWYRPPVHPSTLSLAASQSRARTRTHTHLQRSVISSGLFVALEQTEKWLKMKECFWFTSILAA